MKFVEYDGTVEFLLQTTRLQSSDVYYENIDRQNVVFKFQLDPARNLWFLFKGQCVSDLCDFVCPFLLAYKGYCFNWWLDQ